MVTINEQEIELLVVRVNFSFDINCLHSKAIAFQSSYEKNTPEFEAEVQAIVTTYELNYKTQPQYSTQDMNLNTADWNVVLFSEGVGVVNVEFNVENAVITMDGYYGFPAELTNEERQASLVAQLNQYPENYKIGNDLVDL